MSKIIKSSSFYLLFLIILISLAETTHAQVVQDEILFFRSTGQNNSCQPPTMFNLNLNTVTGNLNASMSTSVQDNVDVVIYDINGKEQGSFNINQGKPASVKVSHLLPGVYFLLFESSKVRCIRKMVIQDR